MSALDPHIRVLRAVSKELKTRVVECGGPPLEIRDPLDMVTTMYLGLAMSLGKAADALEAEQRALEAKVH